MRKLFCVLLAFLMIVPAVSETAPVIELPEVITIVGGEEDEYGLWQEMTLNKGTSEEQCFLGYFLPAGVYIVSNIGQFPVQVTVYKNEIHKEGKWQEFVSAEQLPLLIFAGDEKEMTIGENEFVKVSDGNEVTFAFVKE